MDAPQQLSTLNLSDVTDNSVLLSAGGRGQWDLYADPVEIFSCRDPRDVVPALAILEDRVEGERLHAAGFLSYEASPGFDQAYEVHQQTDFPLLWFGLYRQPKRVCLVQPDGVIQSDTEWEPSVGFPEYAASVAAIKRFILEGDTYQVNFTLRLNRSGPSDSIQFSSMLLSANPGHYAAFISIKDWLVCSVSPELFFKLDGDELVSRPMKGTAPRGLRGDDDREAVLQLQSSEKERAENVMIVDMVRNDMGRIAKQGSVRVQSLFDAEKYPTVWQMTSTVAASTSCRVSEILRALFPAASITGAPKIRTMQIIRELEREPRRIYTGAIGKILPDRHAEFSVAIRTVLIDRRTGHSEYGVGSGVTWQSDTRSEYDECLLKALALSNSPVEGGLLETVLWEPGPGFFLLAEHVQRLCSSALYYSYPCNAGDITTDLRRSAWKFPDRPQIVRLVLRESGEVTIDSGDLVPLPVPYRLRLARMSVDRTDRRLYYKTTDRRMYESMLRAHPGCDDVLMWNEESEITESTRANVILEIEGKLVTPPVASGLLPGVFRAHLLGTGQVTERVVRLGDRGKVSRVFLANSVRQMWEVDAEWGEP